LHRQESPFPDLLQSHHHPGLHPGNHYPHHLSVCHHHIFHRGQGAVQYHLQIHRYFCCNRTALYIRNHPAHHH
ncbi:hypothetical protein CAPTEDRAFT_133890, partial [Capitella teleta]